MSGLFEWYCSCGCGGVALQDYFIAHVQEEERRHRARFPGHWPVSDEEFRQQPCAHCACFDHEPDGLERELIECCACGESYQPMTEIGGRRMFVKDAVGGA